MKNEREAVPTCYLVGAAPEAERIAPLRGDFVIAADGGLDHLRRWGLAPDFVVGDMDSLRGGLPEGVACRRRSPEKDETDMELALLEGLARGFRRFELTGAAGGRPDHTMANLQLLVKAALLGAFAVLVDGDWRCAAITAGRKFVFRGSGMVSLFAFGERVKAVTIAGMKYSLTGEDLDSDSPKGVSNELDGEGSVTLKEGILLCYWEAKIEADIKP